MFHILQQLFVLVKTQTTALSLWALKILFEKKKSEKNSNRLSTDVACLLGKQYN